MNNRIPRVSASPPRSDDGQKMRCRIKRTSINRGRVLHGDWLPPLLVGHNACERLFAQRGGARRKTKAHAPH